MTARCECGCGGAAPISTRTDRRQGWIAGDPKRFINGHNKRLILSSPNDRFWSHVTKGGADECWEWQGSRTSFGHGRFAMTTRQAIAASRAVLLLNGAALGADDVVCHRCDNPPCVNPAHLFIGTQLDNVRDMHEKGRARSGVRQAERTHCPQDHPYDGANTALRNGRRHCRACERERARLNRKKASA